MKRSLILIFLFLLIVSTACDKENPAAPADLAPSGFSVAVNGLIVEAIADVTVAHCPFCFVRYDWGDQSAPSDGINAFHSYARSGRYTITQTVTRRDAMSLFIRVVDLSAPPLPPVARFDMSIDAADSLCVQFEDQSENMEPALDVWSWTFGDGADSRTMDPLHCYATAGTWTVTLRVTNASGSDSFSRRVTVEGGL